MLHIQLNETKSYIQHSHNSLGIAKQRANFVDTTTLVDLASFGNFSLSGKLCKDQKHARRKWMALIANKHSDTVHVRKMLLMMLPCLSQGNHLWYT